MEHGAGQSYGGRRTMAARHGAYAGGGGSREAASLFLHPGPHPAARDRAAHPKARVEVVGAPILDTLPAREGDKGRVVALSFHFNAAISPETKSAQTWIWPAVMALRERFDIIGHAHPRMASTMRKLYARAGIEFVPSFDDVCRRADLYVCDNSSTIFAFAATGRPVVVLNPPWYSRDVDHGLRFWEAATVGVNCDDRATLGDCIEEALADTPAQQAAR
ncbi:MAG TPA: CDP-glycerol glycerophosphotransferase family protein, partial [Actinomycetota bacterium]|nr:CDP-glycerol glycerophosphotransferase family protein [Actinomycetota bacterium]